ncbi:Hypothetical protein Cul210931_2213 [Corynebacterium ulcerans]|nr:Hypothetical protein Cul210931_2213 [Corynebacterium ulcerans]AIU92787.1 Hypothetical protein Cul05146_2252 [Corynebacterium ulcerans]
MGRTPKPLGESARTRNGTFQAAARVAARMSAWLSVSSPVYAKLTLVTPRLERLGFRGVSASGLGEECNKASAVDPARKRPLGAAASEPSMTMSARKSAAASERSAASLVPSQKTETVEFQCSLAISARVRSRFTASSQAAASFLNHFLYFVPIFLPVREGQGRRKVVTQRTSTLVVRESHAAQSRAADPVELGVHATRTRTGSCAKPVADDFLELSDFFAIGSKLYRSMRDSLSI